MIPRSASATRPQDRTLVGAVGRQSKSSTRISGDPAAVWRVQDFARLLGVGRIAASDWERDANVVPGAVEIVARVLQVQPHILPVMQGWRDQAGTRITKGSGGNDRRECAGIDGAGEGTHITAITH